MNEMAAQSPDQRLKNIVKLTKIVLTEEGGGATLVIVKATIMISGNITS